MRLPINRFKRDLLSGKPSCGLWMGLPDGTCGEICAGAGFDWLLIDGEHAPFDLQRILTHLQVIAAYDIPVLVRPPHGETALLKQLLDVGAQSLLIPMVDDAEDAARLVRAVRYPPDGNRGLGTSLTRAARWNRVPEYLQRASDEICLVVQVETRLALENLESIANVPGVDAVFIGPSDLSASLGHLGEQDHPDVTEAIDRGLKTIRAAGKGAGVLALDPRLAARYVASGANFVGVAVDTLLLADSAAKAARRFRMPEEVTHYNKSSAGY